MGLIDNIYDAVDNDELYSLVPKLLADEVGARSCTVQTFSQRGEFEELVCNYYSDEMFDFYVSNGLHQFDAWTYSVPREAWAQGAVRISDFLPPDRFRKTFFYNEFIRHFGDDSLHSVGFVESRPDGGTFIVGLQQTGSVADYSDEQVARLEAARPHVMRMALLRRKLRQARLETELATAGLHSMANAIVVLDWLGRVAFANASAESLLKDGDPLGVCAGRIRVADLCLDRQLRGMVKSALDRSGARGGALLLPAPGGDLRVHVSPHFLAQETHVLLLIEDAAMPADAQSRLTAIYGLTPAQADVAVAASEGLSATEIGDHYAITIATVRTHLQHIYRKMDVTKASQLTRLVASLPGFVEKL